MGLPDYFIRYLQRRDELCDSDLDRLSRVATTVQSFGPGDTIVPPGAHSHSCLMLKGMAGRTHAPTVGGARRTISALHVPGDFVDLHGFVLSRVDHAVVAIGPAEVEFIAHDELMEITGAYPHLTRLLWMSTAIDAAIHRQWIVAANSLRSSAHLAHLLCEIYTRLAAVGAAVGERLTLPLLQRELAEILGYSAIHINRAVRDLRDRKLLRWTGTEIEILDWPGLSRLARFDPSYLDLKIQPR